MPAAGLFPKVEHYYSVLFHELTHSTGHWQRLHRQTLTDLCPFGSTNYSKEELVVRRVGAMKEGEVMPSLGSWENPCAPDLPVPAIAG